MADSHLSLKVGYILKRYPRYSETFIVNEILAHEAAGLEVEIFALRPPSDTHFQSSIARVRAPVTYVPRRPASASVFWQDLADANEKFAGIDLSELLDEDASTVNQAMQLADLVMARNIDHLHAHFGTISTTIARLVSRFTGVPYTFTAHAKDIFHESVDSEDLGRKLADASRVVTVSDFNVGDLEARYPAQKKKLCRIYNGLDLETFPYREPVERPALILSVGRLVEKKGISVLLQACAQLVSSGRECRLEIIGQGELEAELRAQIAELGMESSAVLCGPRPSNEVAQRMSEAALLAVPCIVGDDGNRDGMPTVLLEAMALGTPCIATDVTGIPELIRDGKSGLLVPQNDPGALATAIDRLLSEPELGRQIAAEGRRMIEDHFDIHKTTVELRRVFAESQAGRRAI